ncbi:MAG: oxygen-independent coproporphyrinogen III oxidase [Deltaproteobacteria bacterium]|nr:oxygen-independent coproporphyrinogen III oxidase [Deltaproteobacteria bacterium]
MFEFPEPSEELVRRYDLSAPRYTSYPTAPEWRPDFGPEAYAGTLEQAGREEPAAPFSLYVHLPFCREMCTYCGCNVVVTRDSSKADEYLDHLLLEMDLASAKLGERRRLAQIHWGGGTPTFLTPVQIERLWKAITDRFSVEPGAEVAIEIDPVVTTVEQLALLRRLGFNRLSMGVQDFDPKVQQAVNRIQRAQDTATLVDQARGLGFSGVNFDLIYGLPFQTKESWGRTLERVLEIRPDRLAVYSFAYVPDMKPHQRKIDRAWLPMGMPKLGLFLQAYRSFLGAGYQAIGMDHFALPDDELSRAQRRRALGRNFQGYTVTAAKDSIAFGITGISDVMGAFAQNAHLLKAYYAAIHAGRFGTERGIETSADDRRRRQVITQLMCNFWVDLGSDAYFAKELERLRAFEKDGLLVIDGTQVELTPLGRLFVRNVASTFDAYLSKEGKDRPTFSRTV